MIIISTTINITMIINVLFNSLLLPLLCIGQEQISRRPALRAIDRACTRDGFKTGTRTFSMFQDDDE